MAWQAADPADDLRVSVENGIEFWEVPHRASTRYLSHDYFRYIGRFPPQLPRAFIKRYASPGDVILDPMAGGGTVLIEAKIADHDAIGYDVNPVAVLASRVATAGIEPPVLEDYISRFTAEASSAFLGGFFAADGQRRGKVGIPDLLGNEPYYAPEDLQALAWLKSKIDTIDHPGVRDFCTIAFLSIMRQVSRANVKKMNTEIDDNKRRREVWPTLYKKLTKMVEINRAIWTLPRTEIRVQLNDARKLTLADDTIPLAIVHPPYLTNTAFSESLQLPLAWLGTKHTKIWKKELRARGSYLREPDGLRKYLVDWSGILGEIHRVLRPGGVCVVVVGDGQMNYVRIPVGTITVEFAGDIGFTLEKRIRHRINKNTGMTQSRRMRDQHILVLRKS